MMKEETHVFQGMKRDVHQIRQDGKFLWNAHNIRITNREDNTLLSITNERGPKSTGVTFNGIYVGHCIVGDYLVVFTAAEDGSFNDIYRVKDNGTSFTKKQIYTENPVTSGGWSPDHPIEAIGVYETELVQKVYWVDGVNQPRVINVAKPEGLDKDNGLPYYKKGEFDFVRTLALKETVKVHKSYGSGSFSPGVIQYAMSYYCKNGQESNIFYTTPLQYISHRDRGGSPEETVGNSFLIKINNVDTNFDYIRLYSIHRTSIDSTPTVKVVSDIQISGNVQHSYLDNGTEGYVIDPTQLLYIGGETIVASTIAHKDNTLFLGNIVTKGSEKDTEVKKAIDKNCIWITTPSTTNKNQESQYSTYYYYNPNLDGDNYADFATKETYRTGIQVQYENGKWSSPIFIKDTDLRIRYPWDIGSTANREIQIYPGGCTLLRKLGVRKVRACVVLPTLQDRDIICQGVLCPTVYWVEGRRTNSPYVMSSWFFRAATQNLRQFDYGPTSGANIQFEHNKELLSGANIGSEIQNMVPTGEPGEGSINDIKDTQKAEEHKSSFFVDENIVTFHSPDIEFDQNLWNYSWSGVKLRIIGIAGLGAISGDIDIQTSTPSLGKGFTKSLIGYQTKNNIAINGGLVTTGSYEDNVILKNLTPGTPAKWAVYPWHRSGSLNNDTSRSEESGTRTSVLGKKKISNLRYFHKNNSSEVTSSLEYDISTPQIHTGEDLSVLKLCPAHLGKDVIYMGNIDTLITAGQEYPIYAWGTDGLYEINNLETNEESPITRSKDPVRIKYKSTPHAVFSLGSEYNKIPILPIHTSIGEALNKSFTFPEWSPWGSEDGSNDIKGGYDYIVAVALKNVDIKTFGCSKNWEGQVCLVDNGDNSYSVYVCKYNQYDGASWYGLNSTGKNKSVLIKNGITVCYGAKFDDKPEAGQGTYYGNDLLYTLTWAGAVSTDNKFTLSAKPLSKPMAPTSTGRSFYITRSAFGNTTQPLGASYLLIGELYRDKENNKFGGTSEEALSQNLWIPAGDPIEVPKEEYLQIPFKYGDTWYSRYDCLKTYPFTQEDENSIIDIGSFMLETRVNIDGRYDRNRGQYSNLNMTPRNFNLINPVYSQKDNFFNYRILEDHYSKQSHFKHQLTWTKEKLSGEKIDSWTNITLANTLDMNGTSGAITALKTWNDAILCFQERSFSQVLFNSRVQVPVSDGVPIEISNGYKVEGSRYLSDIIGCANKWSIATTPYGVYFIDSNTESIYRYDGKLTNLSKDKGMDWWVRSINSANIWSPGVTNSSSYGIRTFYDEKYGDVYFTPSFTDPQPDALCYSESLEQFTSLLSYGGVAAMINYKNKSLSLYKNFAKGKSLTLYENFTGDYNNFFGRNIGWDFSFIANENPTYTKIFDTLDLRGDLFDKDGKLQFINKEGELQLFNKNEELRPAAPITFLSINNEYQDSNIVNIDSKNFRQKFRVWRGIIPRQAGTRERIRNPWAMITLGYNPTSSSDSTKAVIHDVTVKYTI